MWTDQDGKDALLLISICMKVVSDKVMLQYTGFYVHSVANEIRTKHLISVS